MNDKDSKQLSYLQQEVKKLQKKINNKLPVKRFLKEMRTEVWNLERRISTNNKLMEKRMKDLEEKYENNN